MNTTFVTIMNSDIGGSGIALERADFTTKHMMLQNNIVNGSVLTGNSSTVVVGIDEYILHLILQTTW